MAQSSMPTGFQPFPSADSARGRGFGPLPGGPPNLPAQAACHADRVVQAGGALASHLLPTNATPFSRLSRAVPGGGMFIASRRQPSTQVITSFIVPQGMSLALCGATIRPYVFDPLAPGDARPLEERRLSSSLGYDLTFSVGGRLGNLQAGLIPNPAAIGAQPAFPVQPASSVGFPALPRVPTNGQSSVELQTAYGPLVLPPQQLPGIPEQGQNINPNQFVTAAGAGGALQPQTQDPKQGPEDMPFTYFVHESESVTLSAVAYAPIRIPLAYLEGVLVGYLMPKSNLEALMAQMRPCG